MTTTAARCALFVTLATLTSLANVASADKPVAVVKVGSDNVGPDDVGSEEEIVATWDGGRLERSVYLDWLAIKGFEDSPDAVRELVFVLSMSASSEARREVEQEVEERRQALLLDALERHVRSTVPSIEDDEIEALRLANPDAFSKPRRLRLRNLYKSFGSATPEDAMAVRAEMDEIHRRLVEGADFETLARSESESQNSVRGGDLGLVEPGELPAPLVEPVEALEPGEFTPPLEHGSGLTIFLCEDVRPARHPTPDVVRARLRRNLERLRADEAWANYEASNSEPDEIDRAASELGLDQLPDVAGPLRFLRTEVLARRELRRRIDARLKPDAAAERRFYEENKPRFRRLVQYEVAGIHFGGVESLATARSVAESLASGEVDFEQAARRHSRHPSASSGGYIGWRAPPGLTAWGPTASRTIRVLEPGEISDLLHLESGLWIFRLLDQEAPRTKTFQEVQDQVREAVRKLRIRELDQTIREEQLRAIGFLKDS